MKTLSRVGELMVAATLFLGSARAWADTKDWPVIDQEELTELEESSPEAYRRFQEAQGLLDTGKYEAAAARFAEVRQLSSSQSLPARRHCEALIPLGQRAEAMDACTAAVRARGSAMDFQALVTALMMGPAAPTKADLAYAHVLAEKAVAYAPSGHWGYAARCEIARATGDTNALHGCLTKLRELAPHHADTQRYDALLSPIQRYRDWLGLLLWGALGVALLGTAVHWLIRAIGARGTAIRAAVGAFALVGYSVNPVAAEPATPVTSGSPSPEASARPDAPELVDRPGASEGHTEPDLSKASDPLEYGTILIELGSRADAARKGGDWANAARLFGRIVEGEEALVKAGKLRSASAGAYRGICDAQQHLKQRALALEACRNAVRSEGSEVADFVNLVRLLLEAPGPLSSEEITEGQAAIGHLNSVLPEDPTAPHLQCELALRTGDLVLLEDCSGRLEALAPKDPKTATFAWALALRKGELDRAEGLLVRAQDLGLDAASYRTMREATLRARSTWERWLLGGFGPLALGLAGCLAGLAVWRWRARPRAHLLENVNR